MTDLPEPLFKEEPDFINDVGTRWWKNDILTRHAEEKLGKGYRVYVAQSIEGARDYLLLDDNNEILDGDHRLDGMSFKIDKHWLIRNHE